LIAHQAFSQEIYSPHTRRGDAGLEEGFDPLVELVELAVERLDAWANNNRDALVAAVTGSSERVGRSLTG